MMLRKDIYLAAAEAIHACMTLISRLPQLEIPNNKLTEDYMAKSSSMAKSSAYRLCKEIPPICPTRSVHHTVAYRA